MNGNNDKCVECIYFSWRDDMTDAERFGRPYDPPDGMCRKIFGKGYVGGKKPHKVFHGQMRCFQFEPKEQDQLELTEVDDENT